MWNLSRRVLNPRVRTFFHGFFPLTDLAETNLRNTKTFQKTIDICWSLGAWNIWHIGTLPHDDHMGVFLQAPFVCCFLPYKFNEKDVEPSLKAPWNLPDIFQIFSKNFPIFQPVALFQVVPKKFSHPSCNSCTYPISSHIELQDSLLQVPFFLGWESISAAARLPWCIQHPDQVGLFRHSKRIDAKGIGTMWIWTW